MVDTKRQAGAEFEVTPEMMEAGARRLADLFAQPMDGLTLDMAKDVFLTMFGRSELCRRQARAADRPAS